MLLKLYYLYEKVPKNCRELCEIVADLRECISMEENRVKPVKASGSRLVTHKLNAMRHILSKLGAYTSHLAALLEDHSIKSTDKAKFRGHKLNMMRHILSKYGVCTAHLAALSENHSIKSTCQMSARLCSFCGYSNTLCNFF